MCGKRQKKMDAVGELIKSGQLLTDATEIGHLKSGDLLQQLQMWIHLKTIRMQVNNRHLLKGSAAAKVADKERLRSLISMDTATVDATVTRGTATVNSTPPSHQQQEDSASPAVKILKTLNRTITFRMLDCISVSFQKKYGLSMSSA